MFGSNPSLDVLARVSFHLSNRLFIDWKADDHRWFLHWLGVSADVTMLKAFFSIKTPTVCAAYENLCRVTMDLRRSTVVRVLFELEGTVRKNSPVVVDGISFLKIAAEIGSRAEGMVNIAKQALKSSAWPCNGSHSNRQGGPCMPQLLTSAAAGRDIPTMTILVEALGDCHNKNHFGDCNDENFCFSHFPIRKISLVMRQLYAWNPEELKDGYTLDDYIQLLVQSGILSTTLPVRCCYDDCPEVAVSQLSSITIDELIIFCPPMKRKTLYSAILRCSNEPRMSLINAGIFTAALEGAQGLLDYLRSCQNNDSFEVRAAMQECLLFAATVNDIQTASSLIQLGVDPEVGLLSNNQQCYHGGHSRWNPMIVAAAAGNLETLDMFKYTVDLVPFLKSAPVHEIIHVENPRVTLWKTTGGELRRLKSLRLFFLQSKKTNSDAAVANGTVNLSLDYGLDDSSLAQLTIAEKRPIETITWIRTLAAAHGIGPSIDNEIIEAAFFNYTESFDAQYKDVGYATYHPCDVLLLDGLVDGNLEYREGDMDLLQLAIRAQCSMAVVELLLSKGLRVHSRAAGQSGNTMLHDALLGQSRDRSEIVNLLLREGADYKYCGGELTILEASIQRSRFHGRLPFPDYLKVFTHLFEAGAPVQHRPRPQLKEWQPLICRLIYAGAEDELVLRVVDAGVNLNERGHVRESGGPKTALDAAIWYKRERLAQQLIQRGANVHGLTSDDGGCTPLQAACAGGSSVEFVQYLVRVQGADVNEAPSKFFGRTALQWAACHGSLSLAEFLLENSADVNALSGRTRYDWPPCRQRALDTAAEFGKLDMVEFLLKAGGRSTLGPAGAIDLAKGNRNFAVLSVLLEWEEQHGSIMMEEEDEW